jgi:hypothetical protein
MKSVAQAVRFIAVVYGACVALAAHALDPEYLEQFPSVEKVLADNQGRDRFDTLARQQAALVQLTRAIARLAGEREFCCQTSDEIELAGRYGTEAERIRREAFDALPNDTPSNPFRKSEQQQWLSQQIRYEQDAGFRSANLARYLGAEQRAALDVAFAEDGSGSASDPSRVELTGDAALLANGLLLVGALLLVLAFVREFMRFGTTANPWKVRAGFASYRLAFATGIVTGYSIREETWRTTEERTDQFGNVSRSFIDRKYVYESFTLKGARGDHHVTVMNGDVNIPDGHLATAVWATQGRSTGGSYLLFFDRTAAKTRPIRYGIGKMLRVRLWVLLPLFAVALGLGAAAKVVFADAFRPVNAAFVELMAVFIMWVVAMIWINRIVIPRRTRRFVRNDAPRILAAVESEERSAPAA